MKTRILGSLPLIITAAIASLAQITFAQNWETVLDFRYFGHGTYLNSMSKDPFGNLFAVGYGSNPTNRALITKSSDGGATWSVSDAFANKDNPPGSYSEYRAIASDGAGNLYAVGDGFDYVSQHWFVRRSQDSGATWSTVLDVPSTINVIPLGIAADSAGNVYVVGPAWAVLKSADAGNSWSVVDAFNPGRSPVALGVLCHPTLGVFVVGHADAAITTTNGKKTTTTYQPNWYVRRSLNGGATWTTVDAYPNVVSARAIAADAVGNLYVTGAGESKNHWIVRKSANGGTAWTTVDDFFPIVSGHQFRAFPMGIAADAYGNVFVGGNINQIISSTSSGPSYWTVRELPAGSSTWQTVDVFQYAPGRGSVANAVVADDFGNVFAAGIGLDLTGSANGLPHWLVRKLVP